MKLAPFGGEQPFPRPSLATVIGYLQSLIEMECERTEGRKHGGPQMRAYLCPHCGGYHLTSRP